MLLWEISWNECVDEWYWTTVKADEKLNQRFWEKWEKTAWFMELMIKKMLYLLCVCAYRESREFGGKVENSLILKGTSFVGWCHLHHWIRGQCWTLVESTTALLLDLEWPTTFWMAPPTGLDVGAIWGQSWKIPLYHWIFMSHLSLDGATYVSGCWENFEPKWNIPLCHWMLNITPLVG